MNSKETIIDPTNRSHRILFVAMIIFLSAVLVGGGIWYVMNKESDLIDKEILKLSKQKEEDLQSRDKNEKEPLKMTELTKEEDAKIAPITTGIIKGTGTYPSERLPTDFKVNAVNIVTGQVYSTGVTSGVDFALEIPAGKYHVYATTGNITGKAYYNKFITCGMKVECTDTTKIEVEVSAGQTVNDITVGDFWNI